MTKFVLSIPRKLNAIHQDWLVIIYQEMEEKYTRNLVFWKYNLQNEYYFKNTVVLCIYTECLKYTWQNFLVRFHTNTYIEYFSLHCKYKNEEKHSTAKSDSSRHNSIVTRSMYNVGRVWTLSNGVLQHILCMFDTVHVRRHRRPFHSDNVRLLEEVLYYLRSIWSCFVVHKN